MSTQRFQEHERAHIKIKITRQLYWVKFQTGNIKKNHQMSYLLIYTNLTYQCGKTTPCLHVLKETLTQKEIMQPSRTCIHTRHKPYILPKHAKIINVEA